MIYLASKSPRWCEILTTAGIIFETVSSDADESCGFTPAPEELVMGLASRKLRSAQVEATDDDIIIAADTIVCYDGIVLGKPRDDEDAFRMLSMLSGENHKVYTGIALKKGKEYILDYDVTTVRMREMTAEEIMRYISTGECRDKAGSYAIQGIGGVFVESINGSYHNVVGLPICKVYEYLLKLGM